MSRVLLIDANAIFRLGLREVVKTVKPELAVSEADTFAKARLILRERSDIALIMLDIRVPDSGGFVGLFQLRSEFPNIPVVMLSNDPKTDQVSRAIAFGAAGIIEKSASCDALLQSLRKVLSGQAGPIPIISNTCLCNSPIESLSPALMRVLMGVKRGLRNKEIAFELGLSEKTIKAYLGILYRKLGVNNRTQAVILLQEVLAEAEMSHARSPMAANVA
jgi:DNA-binding NarL/FixJ family response regulator